MHQSLTCPYLQSPSRKRIDFYSSPMGWWHRRSRYEVIKIKTFIAILSKNLLFLRYYRKQKNCCNQTRYYDWSTRDSQRRDRSRDGLWCGDRCRRRDIWRVITRTAYFNTSRQGRDLFDGWLWIVAVQQIFCDLCAVVLEIHKDSPTRCQFLTWLCVIESATTYFTASVGVSSSELVSSTSSV